MMIRHRPTASRPGFTLVEILVAAALTVLTMAILATAFQVGVNTLSHLRTIGSLSEQLRNVQGIISSDVSAAHLVDGDGKPVRLSDAVQLQSRSWSGAGRKGYFALIQSAPPLYEGDEEGVESYRTDACSLFFTSKLGADPADTFVADITGLPAADQSQILAQNETGVTTLPFTSKWAEIGYFMEKSALTTIPSPDDLSPESLQLYTLFRRQRVLVPRDRVVLRYEDTSPMQNVGVGEPKLDFADAAPELSIRTAPFDLIMSKRRYAFVNTPSDVTDGTNRLANVNWLYTGGALGTGAFTPYPTAGLRIPPGAYSPAVPPAGRPQPQYGTDILLSNVISMQMLVQTSVAPGRFVNLNDPVLTPFLGGTAPWRIDSANSNAFTLRAVQIKLRIYDTKNRVTRQISITQDL